MCDKLAQPITLIVYSRRREDDEWEEHSDVNMENLNIMSIGEISTIIPADLRIAF